MAVNVLKVRYFYDQACSRNLDNVETLAYLGLLCHGIKGHPKDGKCFMIKYIKDEVRVWQSIFNVRFFFFNGKTAPIGPGILINEASRSHSDTPHSVGLLRRSDQPDAETST